MHAHTWFKDQKEAPQFAEHTGNRSRPDGDYQINPSWEQFRYDMGAGG